MKYLLLLAFLAGCMPIDEGALHLHYEGPAEDESLAKIAAADWNLACGRTVVVLDDTGAPILGVEAIVPELGLEVEVEDGTAGWTYRRNERAVYIKYLTTLSSRAKKLTIIEHEMGHALGLKHYDHAGLMAKRITETFDPKPSDCDWSQITYTGEDR